MSAVLEYTYDYIDPSTTVSLYIHGFDGSFGKAASIAGVFDVLPLAVGITVTNPLYDIKLTQGEVSIAVDGTYARTISIQNVSEVNGVGAYVFFIFG